MMIKSLSIHMMSQSIGEVAARTKIKGKSTERRTRERKGTSKLMSTLGKLNLKIKYKR